MVDDSQAKTSAHAVLAAVLQVRDGRLQALLWQRAREPFAGSWALPGGTLAADETLEDAKQAGIEVADVVDAPNTLAIFVWGPERVKIEYVEHKPSFSLT